MVLSLNEIHDLAANSKPSDMYRFNTFASPDSFNLVKTAYNLCGVLGVEKYKFEYNITDNLSFKKKGFYVFVLEDLGFPSINFTYLLYIGRVVKTNNFRNRFYTYRNKIGDRSAAKNIIQLTNTWSNNTFVYFFEMNDDSQIEEIEKIMVNKLIPHFNEDYFSEEAIQTTSLYKLAII